MLNVDGVFFNSLLNGSRANKQKNFQLDVSCSPARRAWGGVRSTGIN
ncbi:hypothetical protein [Paraburkholderia bannensis]|nr:hypothetical protein [Paraburkholderia bannensis]